MDRDRASALVVFMAIAIAMCCVHIVCGAMEGR